MEYMKGHIETFLKDTASSCLRIERFAGKEYSIKLI
jgi:hypothetical protein